MKITAEPRSDQWNADDFIGGPRTFTIAGVKVGAAEQKYDVELVEGEGRVWRPPLTMLRLLVAAWGDEAQEWTGRRVTLYRDESVRFGSDAVGGIRVSHMSDLPGGKPFSVKVTESRARRKNITVDPLKDEPKRTEKSLQHRIAEAISAFAAIGVDVAQLEASVGKQPGDWQADDLAELVEVYKAIKGGKVTVDDAFPLAGRTVDPQPATDPGPEPEGW